jgi:hypothetical protein
MKRPTLPLLAAVVLTMVACTPGGPTEATPDQVAACRQVLQDRLDALVSTGVVSSTEKPDECADLTDAQLAVVGTGLGEG